MTYHWIPLGPVNCEDGFDKETAATGTPFQRHTLKSFIFHYKSITSVTSPLVAFVKFSSDEDYSHDPRG